MKKTITGSARAKYLILLLLITSCVFSQIHPVDINGMAFGPYSTKLYEYGMQGREKFFVNLRLNAGEGQSQVLVAPEANNYSYRKTISDIVRLYITKL